MLTQKHLRRAVERLDDPSDKKPRYKGDWAVTPDNFEVEMPNGTILEVEGQRESA